MPYPYETYQPSPEQRRGLLIGSMLAGGLGGLAGKARGNDNLSSIVQGLGSGVQAYGGGLMGLQEYQSKILNDILKQKQYGMEEQQNAAKIPYLASETALNNAQVEKWNLPEKPQMTNEMQNYLFGQNIENPRQRSEWYNRAMPLKRENNGTLNDFTTFYKGEKTTNPNITDAVISKMWEDRKMELAKAANVGRGEAYGSARQLSVIDTKNNNTLSYVNANELNRTNKEEPGRYVPQAGGVQALTKEALIEDIRGNIDLVRNNLNNPNLSFGPMFKTKIAFALTDRDPKSSLSALMVSGALGSLSPEQEDYLINVAQLTENAMAMRAVLGAGQGSEDLRNAIRATIPGAITPSTDYGKKQVDAFEKVLNRLERGIVNVPLRKEEQINTTRNAVDTSSDTFSKYWEK